MLSLGIREFKPKICKSKAEPRSQSKTSYPYIHWHPSCWNECGKLTTKRVQTLVSS